MNGIPLLVLACLVAPPAVELRPSMNEFMGINGHTILFKPELYSQVCRKVRDYHSFGWDMGADTDFIPQFPEARNRVNWDIVYGSWQKEGFETDVCIMFNETPPNSWKDPARDARTYGHAFAKYFGSSSPKKLVQSVEIGNEPGSYSDDQYRTLFSNMAQGLRDGDPKLKIVTCNMTTGKSGSYDKSVDCIKGLENLYDVLNVHTYAIAEKWPSWKRSYPEDPATDYLSTVQSLIGWRNQNARGKEIWVTEFGWDASTKPPGSSGDAAKWKGNVSDEKQAQYLVRSFLIFSAMEVERAYLYFFNDSDEPSFHAASGITRNFQPKASFHAVAHLYRALGNFRFDREVLRKPNEVYAYEYAHTTDMKQRVLVAWSPSGSDRSAKVELPLGTATVVKAERMPLAPGPASPVHLAGQTDTVPVMIDESPLYIWLHD